MRVDFYVNSPDVNKTACQIVKKAVSSVSKVWVFSDDRSVLDRFDKSLWTFESLAFVPHCMWDAPLAKQTSVWLINQAPPEGLGQIPVLINLSSDTAEWFSRADRTIELVGIDELSKQQGRARFRQYKNWNITPQTIDLQTITT